MDFVSDALFNGKRFRAPTVVDAYTRECLAIHVAQGIKGEQVVDVMDRLIFERGRQPTKIRVDNGPEFISRALDHWAYINRITLDFSRPGKPTDNAFVEAFNGPCGTSASIPIDSCHWTTPGKDRGVADGFQREPTSHIPGVQDTSRICFIGRG